MLSLPFAVEHVARQRNPCSQGVSSLLAGETVRRDDIFQKYRVARCDAAV
jgi:hypothetical protein